MSMKSIATLTLTGTGTNDKLLRDEMEIPKGKGLKGIFAKFSVNIANASGGNVTLTDTQKENFLDGYRATFSYGRENKRKPYNSTLLTVLQQISRFYTGQDWEGFANTSTGLGRVLTNGATTNVVFWMYVPTSLIWHGKNAKRLMMAGRTQASTMELELTRVSDTLPASVTVSGSVTVTIYPDTASHPYDTWFYLPEWYEVDETGKVAKGQQGLHIYTAEDSAVLTSTSLTNIEVRVGREVIYTGINPNDGYIPTLQLPDFASEADTSDRTTLLYQWTMEKPFSELPPGRVEVEQIIKDLATFKLRGLYFPIIPDEEVRGDIQSASGRNGRNKPLKAINTAVMLKETLGETLPETHHAYTSFALVDSDTPEYVQYAGLVGNGDTEPVEVYIPSSVIDNARAIFADYTVKGEAANAEQVIRQVALSVPAAIQDVEGFDKRGSPVLTAVRAKIAA
jgi:hypothetical protein